MKSLPFSQCLAQLTEGGGEGRGGNFTNGGKTFSAARRGTENPP